jgi:gamma-glutamyl phosphate reductase
MLIQFIFASKFDNVHSGNLALTHCITPAPTRPSIGEELFLTATRYVDLIIPRGSESLIQFVRKRYSLVPD